MARLLLGLALVLCAWTPGCQGPGDAPHDPEAWPFAASTALGTYEVRWRPMDGAPVPNNEPFQAEVEVTRVADGAPVRGAVVVFQGDMPGHGHGMLREPKPVEVGDGRYRIDGVLLHMAGHWVVHLDVIESGNAERSTFQLDVE